ncbi:hypothetical protein BESB_062960 [Besnoitia besnoiti]|uniref:Uncharacterized protein n=1 Tax=Besnoitia besnoiti TaxID=94643 RepID=A0A2A9MC11_BESBE|nr:hypothetical protein BESB_062960 [Besnoitia besnoiti]PFH35409.1 hypothetical protein BESB_062960 [Besnoitia besnoiti]
MYDGYSAGETTASGLSASDPYYHANQEPRAQAADLDSRRGEPLQLHHPLHPHRLEALDEQDRMGHYSQQGAHCRLQLDRQDSRGRLEHAAYRYHRQEMTNRDQLLEQHRIGREESRYGQGEQEKRYFQSRSEPAMHQRSQIPESADPALTATVAPDEEPDVFDEQVLEELRRNGRACVETRRGTYVFSPSPDGQTIHCAVYPPGPLESSEPQPQYGASVSDAGTRHNTPAGGVTAPPSVTPHHYLHEGNQQYMRAQEQVKLTSVAQSAAYAAYAESGHAEHQEAQRAHREEEAQRAHREDFGFRGHCTTARPHQAGQHLLVPSSNQLQDEAAPKLVEFSLDAVESVGRPLCAPGSCLSVAAYVHTIEESNPYLKSPAVPVDSYGRADLQGTSLQMIWRGEEFVHMKVYEENLYESKADVVGFIKLQFESLNSENVPMKVMLVGKENEPNGFLILRFSILGSLASVLGPSASFTAPAVAQLTESTAMAQFESPPPADRRPSHFGSNFVDGSPLPSSGPGAKLPTLPVGFLGKKSPEQQPEYLSARQDSQLPSAEALTESQGYGYVQDVASPDVHYSGQSILPLDAAASADMRTTGDEVRLAHNGVATLESQGGQAVQSAHAYSSTKRAGLTEVIDAAMKENRQVPKRPGAKSAQNPPKQGGNRKSLFQRWRRGWCCEMNHGVDLN